MTVKEGEGVSIEHKMKLLNPLLTSKYHEYLFQNKSKENCLHAWDLCTGVNNLAETIIKLNEALDKKNGNEKKELDTKDLYYNQVD